MFPNARGFRQHGPTSPLGKSTSWRDGAWQAVAW